jgi:hypothetical protein
LATRERAHKTANLAKHDSALAGKVAELFAPAA